MIPASRWRGLRAPLGWAAGLGLALAALALRDPHQPWSWGVCPFLWVTGHQCPLCGGLRAVHDLLQGDIGAALGSNPLVVLALPLAVGVWIAWCRARWRGRGDEPPPGWAPRSLWVGALVALVFGVVRDLGGVP